MRRIDWRKLLYWFGLALGLALFGRQLWLAVAALANADVHLLNWSAAAGALGLCLLAYGVQVWAWALIMAGLGAPLGATDAARAYLLPFIARYIPGSVWGYLGRSEWLARHRDIGYALSGFASVVEAGLFVISALVIGAVHYAGGALGWGIAASFAAVAAATWLLPASAKRLRPAAWGQWRIPSPPQIVTIAALYSLFWLLHGAVILLLARSLGGALDYAAATAAYGLAWAAGFLVLFAPAGLGVRESALATLLLRAGLEAHLVNIVAVVGRLAIVVAELILVVLGAALELRRRPVTRQESRP